MAGPRRPCRSPASWSSTPAGRCCFDAGQTAAAARPGHFPRWHPYLRLARFELGPQDEAAARLRDAGIDPAEVRRVVLSHLHTDHAGGLAAFASAEVLVGAAEWRRATGLGGRLRGYLPQHWPAGLQPRRVTFDGPALGPFAASEALDAEGSLTLVPLPGHTPGHLGLIVRAGTGGWLLVGDAARTPLDLAESHPAVARWCTREHLRVHTAHAEAG